MSEGDANASASGDTGNGDSSGNGTGGGDQTPSFTLSEGFQGNELFTGIDSADGLAQAHVDLNGKLTDAQSKTTHPLE